MLTDIKDKIRAHLLRDTWTEPDAVYLLVEIRKVLEPLKGKQPRPYPALWMHCDWTVHAELAGPQAETIVEEIDSSFDKLGLGIKEGTATGGGLSPTEYQSFKNLLGLNRFRDDLRSFLQSNKLATEICGQDDKWLNFLQAHIAVISDVPLCFYANKPTSRKQKQPKGEKQRPCRKVVDKVIISIKPAGIILDQSRVVSLPVEWQFWFNGQLHLTMPSNLA